MYKKKLVFLIILAIGNRIIGMSHFPEAAAQAPPVIGDLNCSGKVDVVDVQVMINVALGIELPSDLDANGDGYVDDCSPDDVGICGYGTNLADGYCLAESLQCPAFSLTGMIHVPGGKFWMGCNEFKDASCGNSEKPQHEAILSAYWIDETEVTVSDYAACVASKACKPPKYTNADGSLYNYGSVGKEQHPINGVTWCQAKAYCDWQGKRLPTEAEWEMAARGSCDHNTDQATCQKSMRIYPWGDDKPTCQYAVMNEGGYGCGEGGTNAVGSKFAGNSPYGVKDMSGNLWEWVEDCYYEDYPGESVTDPISSSCMAPNEDCNSGDFRVVRGGSFGTVNVGDLRVSLRSYEYPSSAYGSQHGFRCAVSIPVIPDP